LRLGTPRVFLPVIEARDARAIGLRGGRAGAKSHFLAELLVEDFIINPDTRAVCLREIQKSLKFSSKALVEGKIRKLGVGDQFRVLQNEIRSTVGQGLMVFEGMQNHNADSIKSLEDFDIAWFEEAGRASKRTLDILFPTIRKEGSQLRFSWNPDQPDDPIEDLLVHNTPPNTVVVTSTYMDNPFASSTIRLEAEAWRKRDPEGFEHVWLGGYNTKREAQIFRGCWVIDDFTPGPDWQGPYHGLDHGFSNDPTAAVRCWIHGNKLFIEYDPGRTGLELDDTAEYLRAKVPGIERFTLRCDNSRPETISYLKRHGLPRAEAADKWPHSVEDGIAFIKTFDQVVIHTRCKNMATEARLYSFKVDKLTGDVLPTILDKNNHWWDAVRYALAPVIRSTTYNLRNIA
jgi:phage terminase large subunit